MNDSMSKELLQYILSLTTDPPVITETEGRVFLSTPREMKEIKPGRVIPLKTTTLTGLVDFMMIPDGREIGKWCKKAYDESRAPGTTVVMLIHARTDTIWFHNWVYHLAADIRFIKGRLKFGDSKNSAPFPSMVVVYR